jgi:glycosyltransferase involved in cell wall biosynthesis
MAHTPSVSVLTPTISGREQFLSRCVRSISAQAVPVEHLIVNGDGLTATQAFQRCLDASSGDYVMPVSDDDWIAPHAVETLLPLLDDADVAFGQMVITNLQGARVVGLGGAVMWRRSLTDRIGGFDTRWRFAGDTDLYGRFAYSDARIAYVPEPLYFFTEHAQHGSYLNCDALKAELDQIHAMYPDAERRLQALV